MLQLRTHWSFLASIIVCLTNISARDIKQTHEADAAFIGAIGCRSSSCHGGAGEKRSQYITWSEKDFHCKAFTILTDARSARIAEAISRGEATTNARCTVCHSPFQSVSQARLASTAHPDEGVSCETCHGAAEPWLRGHTRSDWTYAMRVSAGMRDLRNVYVRANACVACHQNIDSDILKAGHPPLVFELDSQSVNEPRHWREDDLWIGPRSWLVGQAVALREATWWILEHGRNEPEALERWDALAWLLTKVLTEHAHLPFAPDLEGPFTDSDPSQTQRDADDLARKAATMNWDETEVRTQLTDLLTADEEFAKKKLDNNILFERAQRLTLALDRLTNALNANRGAPIKIDTELNALRADVRLRDNFDPVRFAEHLRNFRSRM